MGFWSGVGTVAKGVGKVIGWCFNELSKSAQESEGYYQKYKDLSKEELQELHRKSNKFAEKAAIGRIAQEKGWTKKS